MKAAHKGESPVGAGLTRDQGKTDDLHSAKEPSATHAPRVIEGERVAYEHLARLHAQRAQPGELALILSAVYGTAQRGFGRVLKKKLGVHLA